MKLSELRQIVTKMIKESTANSPEPATKPRPVTKPGPTIKPGTPPVRRPLTPPKTAPETKPKAKKDISENESSLVNQIAKRFKNLKGK